MVLFVPLFIAFRSVLELRDFSIAQPDHDITSLRDLQTD